MFLSKPVSCIKMVDAQQFMYELNKLNVTMEININIITLEVKINSNGRLKIVCLNNEVLFKINMVTANKGGNKLGCVIDFDTYIEFSYTNYIIYVSSNSSVCNQLHSVSKSEILFRINKYGHCQ